MAAPATCARSAKPRPAVSGRGGDPISALTALLTSDGALTAWCGYRYELRLHRARGYGALKAILEILAEEEPLTLTEIAQRLHRTPGSTKDYLSWLEDVDLVVARQKRYSFADPLLRLWVRLHCRPVPPGVDEVAREVQNYALARLPQARTVAGHGRRRRQRTQGLGHHRDRLIESESGACTKPRSAASAVPRQRRSVSAAPPSPPPARRPSWCARRPARCTSPPTSTSTWNILRCSGPASPATR